MHSHRGGTGLPTVLGATVLLVSACASTPQQREPDSATLSEARAAYEAARAQPEVARYGAQALQQAETALQLAQQSNGAQARHFAYLAQRQIEIARAQAREAQARQQLQAPATATVVPPRRTVPGDADDTLGEHARRAHQQAQQARDTALAAQIAASRKPDVGPRAVRELVAELAAMEVQAESTARGLVLVLEEPTSSTPLSGDSELKATLAPVITFLQASPERAVVVEGHTDNRLPLAESLRRSQAQAQMVRALLVHEGVEAHRVQAFGIGPDAPVASNDTASGRARNRRVEVIITPAPRTYQ